MNDLIKLSKNLKHGKSLEHRKKLFKIDAKLVMNETVAYHRSKIGFQLRR